jgi:NADH-quinone oxidoreductase subunit A
MERSSEYLGLLITFLIAGGIAGLIIFLNAILGPKHKDNPVKSQPFECGIQPFAVTSGHFSVKFYLFAMFFILFDVEIVWLFPWAVIIRSLGWAGIAEMFAFVFVLALGFIYAWKKGALEWEK